MIDPRKKEVAEIERVADAERNRSVVDFLKLIYRKDVETILERPILPGGTSTTLEECTPIYTQYTNMLTITVRARLDPFAVASLRVHVRTSTGNGVYDTVDYTSFDLPLVAGAVVQTSRVLPSNFIFMKVIVENLDAISSAYDINVSVTL